jgi:hypothetical protein
MIYTVITSIHPPTRAVLAFAKLETTNLIVVGDKKTPDDWCCNPARFISIEAQGNAAYALSRCLPFNHYSRKMFGYLEAIQSGADVIIDSDDDNIPKKNWSFPPFDGEQPCLPEDKGHINIYTLYTSQKIWPRGLPLRYINSPAIDKREVQQKSVKVGVWQGLADGDPDVDAIYRLTDNTACYFEENRCYVLGKKTITPYNSQNTATRSELFPLLYLPAYVNFRFTDILRGLIAQPIMWLYNYHLGYTGANVRQERNTHDLLKDFESELPMYLQAEKIVDLVSAGITRQKSIENNLYDAYQTLYHADIVCRDELKSLEAWLVDCQSCQQSK